MKNFFKKCVLLLAVVFTTTAFFPPIFICEGTSVEGCDYWLGLYESGMWYLEYTCPTGIAYTYGTGFAPEKYNINDCEYK